MTSHRYEPLQVTAHLASPFALQFHPVNLDALLVYVVCEMEGVTAGNSEIRRVRIPVQESECGRYHLASVGHYEVIQSIGGHTHKRAPIPEMMFFGSKKVRSINTATGRNKSFRVPQPCAMVSKMRWWCIGDAEQTETLLRMVTHVGKKRGSGHGRVGSWTIESISPWAGFPVLRPDGTPTRSLPMDHPGLGQATAIGWGPLSYPYYDTDSAVEVAIPSDVNWMGPT